MRDKITDFVDFPLEGLDMTKRVLSNEEGKQYVYDLYAVSNHFGSLGGGHYTAYAQVDGEWYDFDDSRVTKLDDPNKVKTPAAYVLFYRLRGWEAPTFAKVTDVPMPVESTVDAAPSMKKGSVLAITDGKTKYHSLPDESDSDSSSDGDMAVSSTVDTLPSSVKQESVFTIMDGKKQSHKGNYFFGGPVGSDSDSSSDDEPQIHHVQEQHEHSNNDQSFSSNDQQQQQGYDDSDQEPMQD